MNLIMDFVTQGVTLSTVLKPTDDAHAALVSELVLLGNVWLLTFLVPV
jgi:hypothetical protein